MADTPADALTARSFGAEGHRALPHGTTCSSMASGSGHARGMILAETEEGRRAALAKLLPMQAGNFCRTLFENRWRAYPSPSACSTARCTNFWPEHAEGGDRRSGAAMGISPDNLRERTETLHEFTRCSVAIAGCVGGLLSRDSRMQCRAIFEAAADSRQKTRRPGGARNHFGGAWWGLKSELYFVKARIDQVGKDRHGRASAWTLDINLVGHP